MAGGGGGGDYCYCCFFVFVVEGVDRGGEKEGERLFPRSGLVKVNS